MAQSRGGGGESGFHAGEAAVQGRPEQPPQPSTLFAKTQCAKRSHPKTILRLSSDATARAQCAFPDGRTVVAVMAAVHLSTGGKCLGVWVFGCLVFRQNLQNYRIETGFECLSFWVIGVFGLARRTKGAKETDGTGWKTQMHPRKRQSARTPCGRKGDLV